KMPEVRSHRFVSLFCIAFFLAFCPALLSAEKLTQQKLEELKFSALTEPPGKVVHQLRPYLEKPDPRLAPVMANLLVRAENLPGDTEEDLFEALKKVADRSIFPQAKKMLQGQSPTRQRDAIVLLGLTQHPDAPKTLIRFYEKTENSRLKLEVIEALGNLGDGETTDFLTKVAAETENKNVRDEAYIAAARCGESVSAESLLEINAHLRETTGNLSKNLSYLKREHPEEYAANRRRLDELAERMDRLGKVWKDACQNRAEEIVRALIAEKNAALALQFTPDASFLVESAPVKTVLPLLQQCPVPLAREVAQQLRKKSPQAAKTVEKKLAEWEKSDDSALAKRAAALAGKTSSTVRLKVPSDLEPDKKRPRPAMPYILWDGHRFGDAQRDVRYYRDLGFTHSHIGASIYANPHGEKAKRLRHLFETFDRCDMLVALRFGWDFSGLKQSWQELVQKGIALRKKRKGNQGDYNPLHPELIRHYGRGLLKTVDAYRKLDEHDRIKLLLVGSEKTWGLPKREKVPSAAERTIISAAREDGVLGGGHDDWSKLGAWWARPHRKGRDYRLRKAYEDAVLERIPDVRFWVDPIWAIKIVHGFGGTWTYIGKEPKKIAVATARLQAMCRPAPCAHSTQLIRGAHHDTLMEANLLSICMGADMLYHWGVNTFEPGREENPAYGNKEWEPTPEGFPWFRSDHFEKGQWESFVKRLHGRRKKMPVKRLWDALPGKIRGKIEDEMLFAGGGGGGLLEEEDTGPDLGDLKKPLIGALNEVLKKGGFCDARLLKIVKASPRIRELLERRKEQEQLGKTDLAELNRLVLEQMFGAISGGPGKPGEPPALPPTPEPNLRMLRERVRRKRRMKEPAIRSTGRLLRERGELFRDWKPMQPRVALLSGIYGDDSTVMGLIVGNIPFDILRNRQDRLARIKNYRFVALTGNHVERDIYAEIQKVDRKGGRVLVPDDFESPPNAEPLQNAATWNPKPLKDEKGSKRIQRIASRFQKTFQKAGFRPYFSTRSYDLIMRPYTYRGHAIIFVVNDRREPYSQGKANEIDIRIRDEREGFRIRDLATGENAELVREEDGYHIRDTLEPAWYKIYAVIGSDQEWEGAGPLP
ncbi:MAG: HEAT repeat domain-containing protein, partial [Planctomycetes bacterium]|nr:HEAT repeat domain-containing protein [Planctomycetota bacterium]